MREVRSLPRGYAADAEILERIVAGKGEKEDLDMLHELADTISKTALCGLGKTAPSPVISTMKYLRTNTWRTLWIKVPGEELPGHEAICIVEEKCKGCSKCARQCPVNAITGVVKSRHTIDAEKCIKCGACEEACSSGAIA